MKNIKVVKDEENEIPVEIIEQSIVDIAAAMKRISASRLNRAALVTLLAFDTKLARHKVETVLRSLDRLGENYLNPKKKS